MLLLEDMKEKSEYLKILIKGTLSDGNIDLLFFDRDMFYFAPQISLAPLLTLCRVYVIVSSKHLGTSRK